MASSAGKRKREPSGFPPSESSSSSVPAASSSSSADAVRWDAPYVRHSTSAQSTGVLTIDVHRFGVHSTGLVAEPIPFRLDSEAELPDDLLRKGPPAALTAAVTAINRFVDSPAFAHLVRQVAIKVAAAEVHEAGADPRVRDWDDSKTAAQVKGELLAIVKGLDVSVVPCSYTTNTMLSNLKSRTIKLHRSVSGIHDMYHCVSCRGGGLSTAVSQALRSPDLLN